MTPGSFPARLSTNWGANRPRRASAVAALLFLALALAYAFRQDAAIGSLTGRVYVRDSQRLLAGTRITLVPVHGDIDDDEQDSPRDRHAVSRPDGTFSLPRVPAGDYTISAVARAYSSSNIPVTITEGGATITSLSLDRSQGALQVKLHQRIYATNESPHLSVSGYADEDKPAGTDMMRVRIWKTRLSEVLTNVAGAQALEKVGTSFDPPPTLPRALMHPERGHAPQLVAERRVQINDDPEGFFYQAIDFSKMKLSGITTGLYLIDITHHGASSCAWLLVTDTALVAKRSQNRLLGFAVDMERGTPIAGSLLRAYQNGRVVAERSTDSQGIGVLDIPAGAASGDESGTDSQRVTLVAVRGNDEAVVNQSFYQNEDTDAFTVHTYTDRPIYRPGQHIYFKSVLRKTDRFPADTQARYSVPAGQSSEVELRDPSGERIYRATLRTNRYGSISGGIDINAESQTGVYTLTTSIDGGEHTHDIVIASYRKPEFTVTVTPDRKRYAQGERVGMTISGQYYFGAPVAGAKVKYEVYSAPDWTSEYAPADAEEDAPDQPSEPGVGRGRHEYYGGEVAHGEARLDQNGKAVITFATDNPDRPKFMRAAETYTLTATVTEGENRQAQADGAALITPGEFHVSATPEGYVAAPGKPAAVLLAARDYDNRPVGGVSVDVEMGYQVWTKNTLLFKRTRAEQVTLGADGRLTLDVTPPRAGEFIVKVRARDAANHAIVGRASLYVSDDNGGDLDTEYADLALLTDKRRYLPGDTARVLINAQHIGETVLLTIEGERLYERRAVLMDRKSRVVYIPIRREYGPNAFLAACYVRSKHFAQSSAVLRVATPQQDLRVEVVSDRTGQKPALAKYAPGDRITYSILTTDSHGRATPCEFSFGVVDESIYALKEDDPAALHDSFYPRRSNLVSTDYSFAIQYLGDADKSEPKITARKKFPDTAFWSAFLTTDTRGRAQVSFTLPDSLTTWRATATAHTLDTRVGRAIDKVISAKDFLVRLQMPRFLTQKDQSEVAAFVHNDTGKPQTASVHLTADNLTVGGQAIQTLHLNAGEIGQAKWPVTAGNYGSARVSVKAWTMKESSGTQFTDGLETALPIRPHGREDIQAFAGQLTAANSENEVVRLDPAAVAGLSRLTVHITPSVASSLFGATEYLIGFPYGCTEQTMSRFLPDLLVQRALQQNGISNAAHAGDLPRMVRDGLQRLYRLQHSETGGWGWWEHDPDDPWMTAYVLYGLSEARAQGYLVSDNVLSRARKAAAAMARDIKTDLSDRAFVIYALALAGDRATAATERRRPIALRRLRPDALAHMVLLDRVLGKPDTMVIAELGRRAVAGDGLLHWKAMLEASNWNEVGATAVGLRALIATNPQDPRVAQALAWLMLKRTGDCWVSTRDTALTLAAFCDYLSSRRAFRATGEVRIKLNGALYQTFTLTPDLLKEKDVAVSISPTALRPEKNDVTLERVGGDSPIFYTVQLKQTVATEDLPIFANPKLEIKREYLRLVAKPTGTGYYADQTEPTNNLLTGSDWIRVRLTIKAPRDLNYVQIEDAFPAGCEVNERGDAAEVTEWGYWWSSVDVRDDRIAYFCRTLSKGSHTIEYNLRAQTPGVYHVLPALAQGMYAPETRAESSETRVTIQ